MKLLKFYAGTTMSLLLLAVAIALMVRYNAAHRGAESEVFAALGANRQAIIAYTATRWGLLLKPLPALGFPLPSMGTGQRVASLVVPMC